MKIYLASSWRNKSQVDLVNKHLVEAGYQCFNFTRPLDQPEVPVELPNGFHWSEIDPDWQEWTPKQYAGALKHPIARQGFNQDMAGMKWADACVAIQPFGRSASFEAGWFVGCGKPLFILLSKGEPELMFAGATALCTRMDHLIDELRRVS